jgi:cold shock CspA family protein
VWILGLRVYPEIKQDAYILGQDIILCFGMLAKPPSLRQHATMRINGKIISWNDSKGYGFIEPAAGGKRVFVHINAMNKHGQAPAAGQQVSFTMSKDRQLRPCAAKVLRLGEKPYRKRRHVGRFMLVLLALAFLFYVGFVWFFMPNGEAQIRSLIASAVKLLGL